MGWLFCLMNKVILIFLLASQGLFAQDCTDGLSVPFYKGEKLEYDLVYNWGFIWAKAGRISFEVGDTLINNKTYWTFNTFGRSMKHWDWFYKVRSTYSSVADHRLNPVSFERVGQEGTHFYNRKYAFTEKLSTMFYLDERGVQRKKKILMAPCSFDVVTAIYYCRSIPFNDFAMNEMVPLNMVLDGALHQSSLRYVGKEKWTHPNTGRQYDCILFKPKLIEGTVFSEGENMTVYVTDDVRRIPVFIETELVVGKAKVFLTSPIAAD